MTIEIRKAERKQSKLRIGLSAPSGAGKTYSGLLLAKGLVGDWSKIGLIDSENGRGDFYSDFGPYNIVTLKPPFTPESYIEAIRAMENAGMEVIIVDSVTHEWDGEGGCLQLNEKLAIAKYKGNTWSAWSETTPRHQRFLDAITSSTCHVITTVRNKVETEFIDGKVKKIGTKEIQREGFEYELTVNFTIDRDSHAVMASKDNTQLFEGKDPFVITEQTGGTLREWVMSGAADKTAEEKKALRAQINNQLATIEKDLAWLEKKVGVIGNLAIKELTEVSKQLAGIIAKREAKKEAPATPVNAPAKTDTVSSALQTSAAKHITPATK
jgi:hypothetical protein